MKDGDQNSRIEDYLGVIRKVLDDIAALTESILPDEIKLRPRHECDRDFAYIASRARSEGLNFLTVQLPRLGKWYDKMFFSEYEGPIVGFKPYETITSEHGVTFTCPVFLRMYYTLVLSTHVSAPRKALVMRAYRSLLYLFYKLEVPFSEQQLADALAKWRRNEMELEFFEYPDYYSSDMIGIRGILGNLLTDAEPLFHRRMFRHGPGAVAGGEDSEEKWKTFNFYSNLHAVYPRYDLYLGFRSSGRVSPYMAGEILELAKASGRYEYGTSRLLFVPKDSRGPRTISCEPKEFMFVQQSIARALMPYLTSRSHGRINFLDQSVNASLALVSSADGSAATIDLQDASDRVSLRLLDLLLPEWMMKYLKATRSEATQLPDGSVHYPNQKYAPMGSALCFPIQSCIFWAASVWAGVCAGLPLDEAKARTYVYGDDIITHPEAYEELLRVFAAIGLKVNHDKSYVWGPFRESCGIDAWNGHTVTPFRVRTDPFRQSLNGTLAASLCELASNCFAIDFRETGEHLLALVESKYPGVHRITGGSLGCLHVVDPLYFGDLSPLYWNRRLCRLETRGWVLTIPEKPCELSGLSRLLRAYYGHWELHDPGKVAQPRRAKLRNRRVSVEGLR